MGSSMPEVQLLRVSHTGFRAGVSLCLPFLAASLFALAACSTTGTLNPDEESRQLDHDMFVTGFEDIDDIYITRPNIGAMALAGVQQLSTIDPAVAARREGDTIELLVDNRPVEDIGVTDSMDARHWGEVTADLLGQARDDSPKVAALPNEKIYEAMFSGVISKLDQFSRYASASNATENRAQRDGFGGIGVTISVEDGKVRVISVLHYTPADRLGVRSDDVITEIDGAPTDNLSQKEVVAKLRGPVDSRVTLTIKRAGQTDSFQISLIRALVVPETVAYQRKGDVAYFRIYSFNSETTDSLKREIYDAQSEIGEDLKGYILDLRGNPGGLLNQAVSTSNLFLNSGRIVSTIGRNPDSHQYYEASDGDITDGKPVTVLIDGNSASAAEIVAAALQDNQRAVLIGSNSYGKGTVQNIKTLPNKGEMSLTWARYHAPSGYSLHHLGVLPTICTVGETNAGRLVSELAAGQLHPVPTVARNSVKPDDISGMDALRRTCPARHEDDPIDLETAMRILNRPALFTDALHLAEPPVQSASESSYDKELTILP
jgi:carboxyl-terminal processing protease